MDNPPHDPTKQLLDDCQDEQSKLNDENERLRAQIKRLRDENNNLRIDIAEMEHRTKIAHANGFEEGYKVGRHDAAPNKPQ